MFVISHIVFWSGGLWGIEEFLSEWELFCYAGFLVCCVIFVSALENHFVEKFSLLLQIGLSCWSSLLDANNQSPYAYALMTNNHSYNTLVARKLADRRNGQVTVVVGNEMGQPSSSRTTSNFQQGRSRSCAKCASVAAKYNRRVMGSQGLLQRPYVHSMLAIAAVCVCVCLFLRGAPDIGLVAPFKWETLDYGTI